MNFREMKFEDLVFVENNALFEDEDKEHPDRIDYDYVLEHENYILAAGGFQMINQTTAWAWVQLTKYVHQNHLIPTYRVIKEWMIRWCNMNKIHRLQCSVRAGFEEGKRLAEHLGFVKECRMKDFFGKDKDGWLYVQLMENQ